MRRVTPRPFAPIIAAAAWLAVHVVYAQQPSSPLTLDAAIAQAVAGNKTIAAARLGRAVDQAGIDVARERPNPDLTFESTRETPRQSITGSLPIELGGKRQSRINVATATAATGEAEVNRVIALVRNDVRRAYFTLVAAEHRTALADELRGLMTRAHDTAQARFLANDVARMDVVQAEMDLSDSIDGVTAARADAASARIDLNTLLGRPPDAPLTLADDFGLSPLPPAAAVLAQATAENADLRVMDRRLAEAIARRDLAKAMQVPDVTAGAGLTLNAAPEFNYGWRTAVTMTVPLFTRHQAGVVVEDAEVARLGAERAAIVADLTGAVAAALARAAGARERLANFQTNTLPRALELQAMADDAYRSGQTSIGTLLQALQQARDVRARGLQAGLDYQLALADLERAMGTAIK